MAVLGTVIGAWTGLLLGMDPFGAVFVAGASVGGVIWLSRYRMAKLATKGPRGDKRLD